MQIILIFEHFANFIGCRQCADLKFKQQKLGRVLNLT